ncbi:MAG: transketolase [Planctomycetes bacterium]|nr:transketolase [Planctomycetota bacterium]
MTIIADTSLDLARRIRARSLRMVHEARASHIGACLSIADLLAVLYSQTLRVDPVNPNRPDRDRFILSKGHAAAVLYAVLAERGFFPARLLRQYCKDGSIFAGHCSHAVPGVEVSTGSLGHGLSIGAGMALAARRDKFATRVFVLTGDGECNEGSIWEAALFAGHHRLDNLVAIVDHNGLQGFGKTEDVLNPSPLAEKWRAFGWCAVEIDGHDHAQIGKVLSEVPAECGKPTAVIAETVKGKGVGFMENQLAWHYRSPDAEQLQLALVEVEGPS